MNMKRQNAEKIRITYRTNCDSPATTEYMRGNTRLNRSQEEDQVSSNKKERSIIKG